MKYRIAFFLLFPFFISCGNYGSDINSTSADSTVGKHATGYDIKQLTGVFYDTLPCADCPGIATKLYLKPDMTYIMESEYVDKGTFYDLGTWAVSDSILQLQDSGSTQQLKIVNYAELSMLDKEGKKINNPVKPMALHRNNVPFKPLLPIPVEGIFSAVEDTMKIHICAINRDYAATLAPTAMIMTAKYKQATKQGEPVYAKVAGHFELRPSLTDTTTQDFFVIEKFVKFEKGMSCK